MRCNRVRKRGPGGPILSPDPGVKTHKRKDKTGIAQKGAKRVDEKTPALGYGTGIAAKEHKDRKKKSELESAKMGESSNASLESIIAIARI